MLDWQLCKICYPLAIKLLLLLLLSLLLLSLELLGETRIIIILLMIIIISAGTPLVSNSFHFSWNPKCIQFWNQYILVSS